MHPCVGGEGKCICMSVTIRKKRRPVGLEDPENFAALEAGTGKEEA